MRVFSRYLCVGLAAALGACADEGGRTLPDGLAQQPIIGGQPDSTSHAVVGILTREGELCSGSLIMPNLVLTAHHCVANISGDGESVQCGVSTFGQAHAASDFEVTWYDNLRGTVPNNSVYGVTGVRVPPDSGVCGNDVALLELATNVPADQATPLEPRLDTPPMTSEVFDAVGYGLTNANDQAGTTAGKRMRFDGATVTCVGNACRNQGNTATEWVGQSPVCSGDSGGPALDMADMVIGVTSRGPQACNTAVYSAVTPWKSFILDAATDAATDGGYMPPSWVTGTTTTDGGVPMTDGGVPNDGGTAMPDGGSPQDAGVPMSDAGTPTDAGVPMRDGGTPMDAGTPPSGGGAAGRTGMNMGSGGVSGAAGATTHGAGTSSGGASSGGASSGAANGGAMSTHAAGMSGTGGTAGNGKPMQDGGVPPADAGTNPPKSGAAGSSGSGSGAGDDTPQAAGCGCRTTPSEANAGLRYWSLFLALALGAARRRKRATRPAT